MQKVDRELTPGELAEIRLGLLRRTSGDGVPDLARADLAEMEMRGETRGRLVIRPVASGLVAAGDFQEFIEPGRGTGLSGRPCFSETGRPVGHMGAKTPGGKIVGVDQRRYRRQPGGR